MLLAACSKDRAASADAGQDQAGQPSEASGAVSGPAVSPDGTTLGQVRSTERINLNAIVNKTADEVDDVLGAPKDIGSDRISCVRFVPERVFFACEQEIRIYEHPDFEEIRVEFEDGKAALVAISGLPGEGQFEPEAALALVGIELPDEPHHDNPPLAAGGGGETVDRWEWSNSRARLRIDGLEHRVRLSMVNGEWKRAKVELINNNPLSEEQQARIKLPRGESEPAPAAEPSE
jgi:hypothetical protein